MLRSGEPESIGDYRISTLLGEGGQGTVYLGRSADGTQVAIKLLHARFSPDAEVRRRFLREAEVAASVAAFCTARVISTGMAGDRPYIVSEYVPGPSLDHLVKTDGPRTGSGLERLAVATLTALASIHQVGIVHRDFKPANVILGPEGPVVIDFGIARALDHMTSSTHLVGTPAYMSPEQFTEAPVTVASDMFSWASTMVFAATGRMAFPAKAVPAILHAILNGQPDVSGVPDPLRAIVLACLAKEPSARPPAARLLRDLTGNHATPRTLLERQPGGPGTDPGSPPGPDLEPTSPGVRAAGTRSSRGPLARRWPVLAAAAAAVALAVTAAVIFVPSLHGGDKGAEAAAPGDGTFTLAAFSHVDVLDRFTDDTSGAYAAYRPENNETIPVISSGDGRFTGADSEPFFGMIAGPGLPSSGTAVSIVTAGTFAGTGAPEDSIFVGWVKDGNSYVTAWYNNTRKQSGLNVQVGGAFVSTPGETPLTLRRGDRFALLLSGTMITSYAESAGVWRRLGTAAIGDVLTTAQARQQYRYGFGLRGSSGGISITRTEGRSVPS